MKKVEKQNIPILSPRYGISCSHHPRRLSRTSFYRRLISLFSPRTPSAFSGVPRWTHSVGAGGPDGPLLVPFMSPAKSIPRSGRGSLLAAAARQPFSLCRRRPYFFQQRKKYGKERRQKPTVFGFPLSDSNHGTKRFRIESLVPPSPLPLPRTARRRAGLLSCSGIVASISAVSRIPAHPDRRTP